MLGPTAGRTRHSAASGAGASIIGSPPSACGSLGLAAVFGAAGAIGPAYDASSTSPTPTARTASPCSTSTSPRSGPEPSRERSSSGPTRASTTPRSRRRWKTCSRWWTPGSPTRTASRSIPAPQSSRPTRGRVRVRSPGEGPLAGELAYAQVNLAADIDDTSRRSSGKPSPSMRRRSRGSRCSPAARYARALRAAGVGADRPGVRHRRPDTRLRVGPRHGPPGRRRGGRRRSRHRRDRSY